MNAVAIAVLLFSVTACSQHSQIDVKEMGVLEGKVSIGPLHGGPSRIDQTESDVPPELYAAHKIGPDADQTIRIVIDLKDVPMELQAPTGSFSAVISAPAAITQEVTIREGQTVQLDININAGMR
jgi:hypothetical protein